MRRTTLITIIQLFMATIGLQAQLPVDQVIVDKNGVMRWSADQSELHGFGVNYTLPFAHEYRVAQRAGVSHEEAIRQDVYHMVRLGLDLYRVHVWDTEISDTLGNLLQNEHLRLFDFAVNEMKQRGMCFLITPIAYWGNGWPESDMPTPGFSHRYGKDACLTHPAAIQAQAVYLNQFLQHVNPYTGKAYKDDPSVIGFEICNEPHHNEPVEKVTAFINRMVASMRNTGCSKPVFYNMSHSIHLADAYLKADVQGGTFQWYPAGLVANHQINGNFLPHVQAYTIPFAGDARFKKMAKIVYEFDAADVGGSILYPAMAHTFREAGMQLAAHFAYDALCGAPYNTNYGTHFMNLAYTPKKAISLKIASAVFHHVPLYQQHSDPTRFDGFRISYEDDLAEWVTDEKFFHSNSTSSQPARLDKLREIAGVGSSPLVKFSGTGAYFLDQLSSGAWRLEVMPDAWWVEDPYSPVNPQTQKAAIIHSLQEMTIALPDLGNDFSIRQLNKANSFEPKVSGNQFILLPGVYILKRKDVKTEINPGQQYKNIRVDEYVAPATNISKTTLWNHSPKEVAASRPLKLQFEAAAPHPIRKIQVVLSMNDQWKTLEAVGSGDHSYEAELPGEMIKAGFLRYRVIVESEQDTTKFPGAIKGDPWRWDKRDEQIYTIRVVPDNASLELWNAETDWESSYKIWNRDVHLEPMPEGNTALAIQMTKLPAPDPTDHSAQNYAFKFYFGEKIKGRREELSRKKFLVIKASNYLSFDQPVALGLTDKNGAVVSTEIKIKPGEKFLRIALDAFTKADYLVIPRPFPAFLPYKVPANSVSFNWSAIEMLHMLLKPGEEEKVDMRIEKVWME